MNTIEQSSITAPQAASDKVMDIAKKGISETQDRFLKLLVTQMQNQDPLNPLDNSEVTSQLAQINTVTGINRLNETLKLLVADVEEANSLEAASMIGRNVLIPGSTIDLINGAAIAGIDLPQSVDQLIVTIKDNAGIAIREINLGSLPEGVNTFSWDGETDSGANAVDGNYSFAVTAQQGDQEIPVTALALGTIKSVSPDEQGAILDVGELGIAGLADIKQIF